MSPTTARKLICTLLRIDAAFELLALPFVFMPFEWLQTVHGWFGEGELPDEPIVGYLARSLSALYAFHGAITLFVTFDVDRYRPFIRFWAIGFIVFGAVMLCVDSVAGLPLSWTLVEGPFCVVFGSVILVLLRSHARGPGAATTS